MESECNSSNLKIIFKTLCVGSFITSIGDTLLGNLYINDLIVPIFPQYAIDRGLSQGQIGIIIGLHPLFYMFTTFPLAIYMETIGRKNIILLGCILQGVGCILQATIVFLPDGYYNFLFIAYLARILQGIGAGLYETSCFSILSITFKDSYIEKLGFMETFYELGTVVGPSIGSILYGIGGYSMPFYLHAIFISIIVYLINKYLPNNQKLKDEDQQEDEQEDEQEFSNDNNDQIMYSRIFKDGNLVFNYFMMIFIAISFQFLFPTYGIYLENSLNIDAAYSGFFFGIGSAVYMCCCMSIGYLQDKISNKLIIFISLLLCAVSNIIVGDKKYFGIENSIMLQIISRILRGIGAAGVYISITPEFIEQLKRMYPDKDEELSDMAAALWISSFQLGALFGPLLGAYLIQFLDFTITASMIGWFIVLLAIIFFYKFMRQDAIKIKEMEVELMNMNKEEIYFSCENEN